MNKNTDKAVTDAHNVGRVTVTKQQLNERLDGLRDAMASVRSCKRHERLNETAVLFRVMQEIIAMELDHTNPALEERKIRLLEQASQHLRDYGATDDVMWLPVTVTKATTARKVEWKYYKREDGSTVIFANRAQAIKKALQLGPEWSVHQSPQSRRFYVRCEKGGEAELPIQWASDYPGEKLQPIAPKQAQSSPYAAQDQIVNVYSTKLKSTQAHAEALAEALRGLMSNDFANGAIGKRDAYRAKALNALTEWSHAVREGAQS